MNPEKLLKGWFDRNPGVIDVKLALTDQKLSSREVVESFVAAEQQIEQGHIKESHPPRRGFAHPVVARMFS